MRCFISRLFGYRYAYRVKLEYKKHRTGAVIIASNTRTVYLSTPNTIGNHREIKKALAPELIKALPRRLLCNGFIYVEPVCYLGWVKWSEHEQD
jgi:hypothetical protein